MAISTATKPKAVAGKAKGNTITAKMVDDAVKKRGQKMGKGPKGGRMPYESDGESYKPKAKSKK
jgi:hypothetical protein